MSAKSRGASPFEALCAGASGYLVKPASASSVVSAIHELTEGGVPMNAQVARKVLGMFTQPEVTGVELLEYL